MSFNKHILTVLMFFCAVFSPLFVSLAQAQESEDDPFIFEPEQTIFDFYVGGNAYGNLLVTYTDEWVEIDRPTDALEQMPVVNEKDLFLDLLSQRIPVPSGTVKENVGELRADPYQFRIDLQLNRNQIIESALTKGTVAPPVRHITLKNNVRITGRRNLADTTATPDVDRTTSTISHITSLSKGRWRANFSGTRAETTGEYDFSNYSLSHDVATRTYSLGLLQSAGTTFASSQSYFGAKLKSNYTPLNTLAEYKSTPIEIYVPSRARVNIYRNETELLYSDIYSFGIHKIPTRRFPEGSYDLRIEIEEDTGITTEERRVFAKNTALNAFEHPEYEFSLGVEREGTEFKDAPLFQGSITWRALDELNLSTDFYTDGEIFLFEPALDGAIGTDYEYDAALSITSEDDIAFRTNASYNPRNNDNLSWNIGFTHMLSGHEPLQSTSSSSLSSEEADDLYPGFIRETLARARTSLVGGLSYRLKDITWRYSLSYNKAGENADYALAHGPSFGWTIFRDGPHTITTNGRLIRSREATDYSLLTRYRYVPTFNNWSAYSEVGRGRRSNEQTTSLLNSVSYDSQGRSGIGTSFTAAHQQQERSSSKISATEFQLEKSTENFTARVGYRKQTADDIASQSEDLNYSIDSQILVTRDPLNVKEGTKLDLTSLDGNVVIELEGNAKDTEMIIYINGNPASSIYAGQTISLNVADYRTHTITLEPALESSIVHYNAEAEVITPYPDNVFRKTWRVDNMTLVLGRLIDVSGKPVKWQSIKGIKKFATTDSEGNFQIELIGNEMPFVNDTKNKCTMALPNISTKEAFQYIGDIICS